MGSMNAAREQLRQWIVEASPGARVASVETLSTAAGGLSTAATVEVLREAIEGGWIKSTRGARGGYWRTEKLVPDRLLDDALDDLAAQMEKTLQSVRAVKTAVQALQAVPTMVVLESAVLEAAYGSAVQATWESPDPRLRRLSWVRLDSDELLHAGDPFGRLLIWLHNNGYRRLAAIGVHSWVTTVCNLTAQGSDADRATYYQGIAWATSFPNSPINSVTAVAALDAEGAQY